MTRRRAVYCGTCGGSRVDGVCEFCSTRQTGQVAVDARKLTVQEKIMRILRSRQSPLSAGEIRAAVPDLQGRTISSCLTTMQDKGLIRVAAGYEAQVRDRRYEAMPAKAERFVPAPAARNITPMSYRSMLARGLA